MAVVLHFIVEGIWFLILAIVVDIWAASRLFGVSCDGSISKPGRCEGRVCRSRAAERCAEAPK
jgi:hypothetical protein